MSKPYDSHYLTSGKVACTLGTHWRKEDSHAGWMDKIPVRVDDVHLKQGMCGNSGIIYLCEYFNGSSPCNTFDLCSSAGNQNQRRPNLTH